MRVQFQAGQCFDLRYHPARFLSAGDFVSQRDFSAILQSHSNRVQRVVRTAALLHADHRQNGNHFGNLDCAGAPQAEDSPARKNLSAADANKRTAKRSVQKTRDDQYVRQAEKNKKQHRRMFLVHQVNHRAPDHGDNEQNQCAAGIPQRRKIEFGAAGTRRNDGLDMRGLRDVVGIRVGGLRCRKSESVRSTCNSHSEITRRCGRSCAAKNGNFKIVRVIHPGHVRLRVEYPKNLVVRIVEIGYQTVCGD